MTMMTIRSFAVLGLMLVACGGDSNAETSSDAGSTSAASSDAGSTGTSEPGSTGAEVPTTSGAEASSGGGTTTGGHTTSGATTGAIDDTGSSSGGSSTGGDTTGGADTAGDSSTGGEGEDSSTGGDDGSTGVNDCSELGDAAESTVMALEAVTAGVLYSSEGDYPWTVISFVCMGPVTVDNLKEIIAPVYVQNPNEAPLAERVIEVRTFAQFFDALTVPKDWWDDGYYEQAEKYLPIRKVLEENLTDLQVFRLGELSGNDLQGAIDVYILGRSGDDLVGMWTIAIET